MIKFNCEKCGKEVDIQNERIYNKTYKGHDTCLDCRSISKSSNHGGGREGAGRPSLGTTKKVSLTLPDEVWEELEEARGDKAMSAMLREIIMDGIWI